jgi:hypothetical protein
MGLDIHFMTDNSDVIFTIDYHTNFYYQHRLSRTFCNFMCRKNAVRHEPELDQIGKITGVDISPLYDMEQYPDEEEISFSLHCAKTEEERQLIIKDADATRESLKGNIDKVYRTVNELIDKLNSINNLPSLFEPTDFDSLQSEDYFSDFVNDKGDGYINNNFGHDLRNFQHFLTYAKSKGSETVWFKYG